MSPSLLSSRPVSRTVPGANFTYHECDDDGPLLFEVECFVDGQQAARGDTEATVNAVYVARNRLVNGRWVSDGWCELLSSPVSNLRELGVRIVTQVQADKNFFAGVLEVAE